MAMDGTRRFADVLAGRLNLPALSRLSGVGPASIYPSGCGHNAGSGY